jgi:hypothetical protein
MRDGYSALAPFAKALPRAIMHRFTAFPHYRGSRPEHRHVDQDHQSGHHV